MRWALLWLAMATCATARADGVVSLAPHLTEMICAAGACDQLRGVDRYSNYPAQVEQLPRVADAFGANAEAILALNPDMVLSWDGGTSEQTVAQLRRVGLRVEPIRVRTLEDLGMALLRVGALLGTEDAACAAEENFREQISGLRARYAQAPAIAVMYQQSAEPIFTVNRDSPISEALALCGAQNIFDDYPQLAGPVGREAVLARDPGAIVFSRQDNAQAIRQGWLKFSTVRAVAFDNLIEIDADKLARATPRMAQGIAELCEALDGARARLAQAR